MHDAHTPRRFHGQQVARSTRHARRVHGDPVASNSPGTLVEQGSSRSAQTMCLGEHSTEVMASVVSRKMGTLAEEANAGTINATVQHSSRAPRHRGSLRDTDKVEGGCHWRGG